MVLRWGGTFLGARCPCIYTPYPDFKPPKPQPCTINPRLNKKGICRYYQLPNPKRSARRNNRERELFIDILTLNLRADFSRPALCHEILNSLYQVQQQLAFPGQPASKSNSCVSHPLKISFVGTKPNGVVSQNAKAGATTTGVSRAARVRVKSECHGNAPRGTP